MAVSPVDSITYGRPGRPAYAVWAHAGLLALDVLLDATACVRECQQRREYARTADAIHDAALRRSRRHIHAAHALLNAGDAIEARRHLIAADACAAKAEEHDASADRQHGFVDAILAALLAGLRVANGALDAVLPCREVRR